MPSHVDKNTDTPLNVGTPTIKSLSTTTSCYITKKGKKYHIAKKCADKSAKSISISKAKKKKKTACKKCATKRNITVKYSRVSGATGYQVAYKTEKLNYKDLCEKGIYADVDVLIVQEVQKC